MPLLCRKVTTILIVVTALLSWYVTLFLVVGLSMPAFQASAPVGQESSPPFGDPCPKTHSLNVSVDPGGLRCVCCVPQKRVCLLFGPLLLWDRRVHRLSVTPVPKHIRQTCRLVLGAHSAFVAFLKRVCPLFGPLLLWDRRVHRLLVTPVLKHIHRMCWLILGA